MALHVITQLSEQPPVTSAVLRAELCPLGLHEGRTLSPFLLGGKGTGGTSSANSRLTRLSVNGRLQRGLLSFPFWTHYASPCHVCIFFSAEDIKSRTVCVQASIKYWLSREVGRRSCRGL